MAKSSYYFYSGWTSLIHSSSCSIYDILGFRGLVENVRITLCGEGSKFAQKHVI